MSHSVSSHAHNFHSKNEHVKHPRHNGFCLHERLAEDSHPIAEFELSSLRLMDDANYPWLIVVPHVDGATEITDLDTAQQARLMAEIDRAARLAQQVFRPHKLNIAALGNLVPQLHVHVIARFHDDPAWPAPVWGLIDARSYEPDVLVARVNALRSALRS